MKQGSRTRAMLVTALFFMLLTFVGLWVAPDYGLPCDEPAEQTILRENLLAYSLRLSGPDSAAAKYYTSLGVQPIAQSVERDHGEAAYYLAAPLLTLAETAPDKLTTLWRMYTWLWFMAGVYALYRLMRSLGLNRVLSCFTALMLYLSPRFFAEGHYNNKDVILLVLVLCTLASGARFLRRPTFPRALLFSLFGALATNTKIVGALAWGLVGLATLLQLIHRRKLTPKNIVIGLSAIGSFLVFYVLLTPALWADPAGFVGYMLSNATAFSRWTGVVYFNGIYYNPTRGLPMPRFYLPEMIALTIPIPFLVLAAIGQVRAIVLWRKKDVHRAMLAVVTALWLLPVL
ncbi:MAG: phospholipid carrier-dependent glycosyltransferase, partial [Eubacteriales bacterium]|nr:phospholipid carrier-dependent glycosyltransferase [Eubacteriales bacterium]